MWAISVELVTIKNELKWTMNELFKHYELYWNPMSSHESGKRIGREQSFLITKSQDQKIKTFLLNCKHITWMLSI